MSPRWMLPMVLTAPLVRKLLLTSVFLSLVGVMAVVLLLVVMLLLLLLVAVAVLLLPPLLLLLLHPAEWLCCTAVRLTTEQVNWMKEAMGLQSSRIPQFPEYDARGRQLQVHRCTFNKGQKVDLYV